MTTLGIRFKSLRSNKGLSQPELAKAVGIEQSYLSKLENDKSFPSDEIFLALLETMNVDLNEFLEGVDPNLVQTQLIRLNSVQEHLKTTTSATARFMITWILISAFFLIMGITMTATGYNHWLKTSDDRVKFEYESLGITFNDESHWIFAEAPKDMSPELLRRLDYSLIQTDRNVGDHFIGELDYSEGERLYQYVRTIRPQGNTALDRILQIIGVLLAITGLTGLIIEPRLRRYRSSSN